MQYYWIDALAPLVFRNAKPFEALSDTNNIVFPSPAVAAGFLRSVSAQQQKGFKGNFDTEALRQIAMGGVFLAQKDDAVSGSLKLFVPAPIDAIYPHDEHGTWQRYQPQPFDPDECGCDLNEIYPDLQLLFRNGTQKSKASSPTPFWAFSDFLKWHNGENLTVKEIEQNGITQPLVDVRTHVAIDDDTRTNQEGSFFQTAGYDLANCRKPTGGWETKRLGFVIASECVLSNDNDLVRFGGEGRLSYLQKIALPADTFRLPEINSRFIKLILLTPAVFGQGWLPTWLNEKDLTGKLPHTSLNVKLHAVAANKWQAISGWDLDKNCPKPMRKMVPTGSIYWLEIQNDDADIQAELQKLAYKSVCDDEQDQRDGFGIVAVAEWKK